MSPPFDILHRDNAWLCSLPPSEGRPGIDATVLLCRDDCQLRLSQVQLGLDLAVRIPLKPATDSETKPATCSDFIPASIPI